ncbi:ROK family protein [Treponema sp. R6D11]
MFDFPVNLINDARAAGLAEFQKGALKGAKNSILLTLGTGIGGCIFLNGSLFRGKDKIAGEVGHLRFGKQEWEKEASGRALINLSQQFFPKEEFSVGVRSFFAAIKKGDKNARLVMEKWVKHIAIGVNNLILTYNPEVIAFGGGAAEDFACYEQILKLEVENILIYKHCMPKLKKAAFGNLAGLLGSTL